MDNLYFDELEMEEKIEKAILDYYKNDSRHEKNYWFNIFGKKQLKFYSSLTEINTQEELPKFPCAVITIESQPDTTWSNSTQIEQVSIVNFSIEFFTVQVGNTDKKILGNNLSNIITLALRNLSGNIKITKNAPLINIDNSIYRRIIRGAFKYNNKTKTFYKGD